MFVNMAGKKEGRRRERKEWNPVSKVEWKRADVPGRGNSRIREAAMSQKDQEKKKKHVLELLPQQQTAALMGSSQAS